MSIATTPQTSPAVKQLCQSLKQAIQDKDQFEPQKYSTFKQTQSQQFMSLMRKIMVQSNNVESDQDQKFIVDMNCFVDDGLDYIAEESHQCSQSMIMVHQQQFLDTKKQAKIQTTIQQQGLDLFSNINQKCINISHKIQDGSILKCVSTIPNYDQNLSSRQAEHQQGSSQQGNSFTQKLIQITSRCIQYYNKFSQEKTREFQIIQKSFGQVHSNLNSSFDYIICEANKKRNELMQFMLKKYKDIIDMKNQQDQTLKATLSDIKEVHLTNLLNKNKTCKTASVLTSTHQNISTTSQPIFPKKTVKHQLNQSRQAQFRQKHKASEINSSSGLNSFSVKFIPQTLQSSLTMNSNSLSRSNPINDQQSITESCQLSVELHNYALTLNIFYSLMEDIQKTNYKEIVYQTISFIGNLINEEIKSVIYEKIPLKLVQNRMLNSPSNQFLHESTQQQQTSKQCFYQKKDRLYLHQDLLGIKQDIISPSSIIFTRSPNKKKSQLAKCWQNRQNFNFSQRYHEQAILQCDSFTKLFLQQSKSDIDDHTREKSKLSMQPTVLKQQQNIKKPSNLKAIRHIEQEQVINSPKQQKPALSSCLILTSRQNPQDQPNPFNSDDNQFPPESTSDHLDSHFSSQIIRKISSQQNDRSAKIRSYLVTFQESRQALKSSMPGGGSSGGGAQRKIDKSPVKANQQKIGTTRKRDLSPSNLGSLNHPSTQKNCSVQSSRGPKNSIQVSQFGTSLTRRVSVAFK